MRLNTDYTCVLKNNNRLKFINIGINRHYVWSGELFQSLFQNMQIASIDPQKKGTSISVFPEDFATAVAPLVQKFIFACLYILHFNCEEVIQVIILNINSWQSPVLKLSNKDY